MFYDSLLIPLFIIYSQSQVSYSFSHSLKDKFLDCRDPQFQQALDIKQFSTFDLWIFLIGGPLGILTTAFILILSVRYPKIRKSPGDLFIGTSISEMILSIHWFMLAMYQAITDGAYKSEGYFCIINGFISIWSATIEGLYNCFFFLYLILISKRSLKINSLATWKLHLITQLIGLLVAGVSLATDQIGKSNFITCSFKAQSKFPIAGVVILILYVTYSISTLVYLNHKLPDINRYKQMKKNYMNFSTQYLYCSIIIWSTIFLCDLIIYFNCKYFHDDNSNIAVTIGNFSKIVTPILLPLVRLKDPNVQKVIRSIKVKNNAKRNERVNSSNQHSNINGINESFKMSLQMNLMVESPDSQSRNRAISDNINKFLKQNKNLEIPDPNNQINNSYQPAKICENKQQNDNFQRQNTQEAKDIEQEDIPIINLLSENNKINILIKIISGIQLSHKKQFTKFDLEILNIQSQNIFQVKKVYFLDDQVLQREVKGIPKRIFDQKNQEQLQMTVHCPVIFHCLIKRDKQHIDVEKSLNILKNWEQIKASSGSDGGKSGQFFFFTYDNQLLLKTITGEERKVFLNKLESYFKYLTSNDNSLIAKIFGLYDFEGLEESNSISLILMKNMAGVPKEYIQRTYDLKGSSFDREVIKNNNTKDLKKLIMKDIDFLKLEKKLYIDEFMQTIIIENAQKDANFFRECELIDYSLIVFKIDWLRYVKEKHKEFNQLLIERTNQTSTFLKSTIEEGIYYHIGIIDYFQQYNIGKKVEKYTKKLIKFNKNLDTSSQDPIYYCNRFINFVQKISCQEDNQKLIHRNTDQNNDQYYFRQNKHLSTDQQLYKAKTNNINL